VEELTHGDERKEPGRQHSIPLGVQLTAAIIVTIIAIGETYRVVAVSKLALRRARAAAHAAAFSLFGPMLDSRHEPRGHICRAATAAWYQ